MEPSQQADLLLIEVGRAISAKNADTVRGAIVQLQSLLDTLKKADAAEETAEGVAEAAIAPDHAAMTGEHSHPHPAYGSQGADATHAHAHSHDGDAVHQHDHGGLPASADKTSTMSETALREVNLLEYAPLVGGGS